MNTRTAHTSKGEQSRRKLVDATAQLLRKQGYHATGLSEIVETSGAPRGSLYFYFPGGKEELTCAALAESGARWQFAIEAVLASAPDLAVAVERVCAMLADALEQTGYEDGCPLATVALEAATSSERVRQTCGDYYRGWQQAIADRLAAAGVPADEATRAGTFGLAAIEGAMLLAKVHRDRGPLVTTGAMLRDLVAQALARAV